MTVLQGLSGFPITPADRGGRVDIAALRKLVARIRDAGAESIGVLGSTGSYPYLTRAERGRALDGAMEESGGKVPVLVGVGALRTDEAVLLARDAKDAGADAGLLAPVSYTPLTEDEVFEHFAAVARGSGLPLCIYDNPATTHFRFSAALIGRLSQVDGIVAVKSPAPEASKVAAHLAELRALTPQEFSVGCSVDANAVEGMIAGADAWYSAFAGLFPRPAAEIVAAVRRGDAAEARRLNAALEPLWALFRELSGLRVLYACADILGICGAVPPRPILPLTGQARQRVADVLERAELA